jgi:hypothetical protein
VPPLLVVVIAIVLVGGMLLWMGALADAAQYDDAVFPAIGRTKRSTLTVVALTWAVGGAWYWLRAKPRLRRADPWEERPTE